MYNHKLYSGAILVFLIFCPIHVFQQWMFILNMYKISTNEVVYVQVIPVSKKASDGSKPGVSNLF